MLLNLKGYFLSFVLAFYVQSFTVHCQMRGSFHFFPYSVTLNFNEEWLEVGLF